MSLEKGLFSAYYDAHLEFLDRRKRDPILGEHTIVVKPDSNLTECKLYISYFDKEASSRFQTYSIFPDGLMGLPSEVYFEFEKIYKMAPSTLWKI